MQLEAMMERAVPTGCRARDGGSLGRAGSGGGWMVVWAGGGGLVLHESLLGDSPSETETSPAKSSGSRNPQGSLFISCRWN